MFYVRAHLLFFAVIGGAATVFAVAYFALERLQRGRYRRVLGGLHFAMTTLGVILLTPAITILAFGVLPAGAADIAAAFRAWTVVAGAGYGLVLAAQVFFVAVLIDAFRRGPHLR
ncbi:MAG: hypothetical protein JNL41_02400 [Phenylobacterium sp.]|uniref:hypothetical protein n=1 Tax=Phenylobacterium sp. TaxID=1871053 RepID=UPI001A388051|nr:hypothetical protein [Phenylobacterium sp.]MBL8553102.1 hypothetical protein [Phenylobacterium sp.]